MRKLNYGPSLFKTEEWWCNRHGALGLTWTYVEQVEPRGQLFCRLCLSKQVYSVLYGNDMSDPVMRFRSAVLKARMK